MFLFARCCLMMLGGLPQVEKMQQPDYDDMYTIVFFLRLLLLESWQFVFKRVCNFKNMKKM